MTAADFQATLAAARASLDALCAAYPDNGALSAASRQLAHVAAWTRDGAAPSLEDRQRLSFGLIAAREIEPLDPDLADQLYALAEHLRPR